MTDIYAFDYLRGLFDEMAASYDRVNYLTSFGFSARFRRQFVERAELQPGHVVLDLMCGRGECWPIVLPRIGIRGRLVALDLSPGMLAGARARMRDHDAHDIVVAEGNALSTELASGSMDRVIVAFGLKTLAPGLRAGLASELHRVLRAGGVVSMIEMSEPRGWLFRGLFMWYLKRVVPVLGRLLLGNPANYRMLGVYTERFEGCAPMAEALRAAGFDALVVRYFHGCATGIVARKAATV